MGKKYRIEIDVTDLMPDLPNSTPLIERAINKHVIPGRFAIESCTITEVGEEHYEGHEATLNPLCQCEHCQPKKPTEVEE